jgi:hypothetical protein
MPATLYACRDPKSTPHTPDRASRHHSPLHPERSAVAWIVRGVRFLGMPKSAAWCVSLTDGSARYDADAPIEKVYFLCHARRTAVLWIAERNIAQGYGSPHTATPCARYTATLTADRPAVWRDVMPRVCSICMHPDRLALEAALRARTPLRTIATHWSVSKTALLQHRDHHMYSAPVIPPAVEPAGALAQVAIEASQTADTPASLTVAERRHPSPRGLPASPHGQPFQHAYLCARSLAVETCWPL